MRKEKYLDKIDDIACTTNAFVKFFGFLGTVGTGILAIFTPIMLPFIITSSIFGLSVIDSVIGKISKFKEKDVTPYFSNESETRSHAIKQVTTTPPLIYNILALPSLFMSDKSKKEILNNNLNIDKENDTLLEKRKQLVTEKNTLKENTKDNQLSHSNEKIIINTNKTKNQQTTTNKPFIENNNQLEM